MSQRLTLPRRWAVRLLLVVLVAVGVPAVTPAPAAFACSCAPSSIAERTQGAQAVFVGTAEPGSVQDDPNGFGGRTFRIEVGTVFLGEVPSIATVVSANSSSACGLNQIPSGKLIWFGFAAPADDADLQVSLCSMPELATEQNIKVVMETAASLEQDPGSIDDGAGQQTNSLSADPSTEHVSSKADSSAAESWGIAVAAALGAVVLIVVGLRVRRRVNTPQP